MWEAMYNPLTLRRVVPKDFLEHPNPKKRKTKVPILTYQLLAGHHRLRLHDALDADYLWVMMVTGHHRGSNLPDEFRRYRKMNSRIPRRGTRTAICSECGTVNGVSSRKINEFNIPRRYTCSECGHHDDEYQPYPERI